MSLVTIATYFSQSEAHISKAKLISYDIPAWVVDENFSLLYSSTLQNIRLQVPKEFQEKAMKILEQDDSELLK